MARGFLQYILFQKYFGIELLGASTTGHFFTILSLADGTYLSMDWYPEVLSKDDKPLTKLQQHNRDTNYSSDTADYFNVGSFESIYKAEVLDWEASNKSQPLLLRAHFLLEAIRLNPNHHNYLFSLANRYQDNLNLFAQQPEFGSQEAVLLRVAELYKEAIRLNPNNYKYQMFLAFFYESNLNLFAQQKEFDSLEAVLLTTEELYKQSISLAEQSRDTEKLNWYKLSLADFYQHKMNKPTEALALYREVLRVLEENPEMKLFLDKGEIARRIGDLKEILDT